MSLWHYTCDHGHERIDGLVVPGASLTTRQIDGPGVLAWFTDLDAPIRDALGLTSQILACDRTAHRYRVTDAREVVPWVQVRRLWSWASEIEQAPRVMPRHWYVAAVSVPVVYDPILVAAS